MKRKNVIILVLAVLLLISLLTACGSNVSFKIDFIVDGAVIHTIDTKGNEEIQLPADPEKEGYIFDGWYWDKDTWEKPFTANSLLNAPLSENMSVYAKWKTEGENEVQTYTITFNSNGGGDISAITKEAGESITEPTAPTKTGYTFDGWYTDNNTFQNEYTFSTMPAESFTLYAKWLEYQRINASGEPAVDGDYILFGEYPQTIKANEVTVGTSADTRGYYLGSDGYYYAKVTATPYSSGYTFSTNATVSSGTVYYFKVEPIKWRILSEENGTALILCESIIANKRYDDSSNNYMNSEIRAWLNGEFYNKAFTALQQELIQITNVDNSVYSTGYSSNPYTCANTNDKIFLPSYREMVNTAYGFSSDYIAYDTARRRLTSDYSRATGVWMNTNTTYYGNGSWWLRSPSHFDSNIARDVYCYGCILDDYVSDTDDGVVPALKIRLS